MSQLTEVRRKAGRIGGIVSSSLYPKSKDYLSKIGKLGGRPKRKTYSEIINGNGN